MITALRSILQIRPGTVIRKRWTKAYIYIYIYTTTGFSLLSQLSGVVALPDHGTRSPTASLGIARAPTSPWQIVVVSLSYVTIGFGVLSDKFYILQKYHKGIKIYLFFNNRFLHLTYAKHKLWFYSNPKDHSQTISQWRSSSSSFITIFQGLEDRPHLNGR